MKDIVSEYQEKFRRNRQYLRRYTALLLALAFTTTLFVNWQLRSVGIAKTADYQCGLEEHDHTDACYARVLVCGYEEGEPEYDAAVPDTSFDSAFAVDAGNDPDISTYAAEPEPEYIFVPHEHTDDCWQEVRTLTCYEEEHEHTDDCFDEDGVTFICDKFEHVHDDNCYNIEYELVCGLEEGELVEEPNPDYVAADEDAFAVFDSGISALPAMDLKPVVADDSSPDVPVHHHTSACYEEELICGLPEHHHTVNCLADPLDGVEDEDAWLSQTGTSLTGLWTDDLLAVAESQLDYEQSEKNFKLDDADGTTVHYYTRYGAWYGNSYGPWDVMFLSYCLNYAGIPQSAIPQVSSVQSLHSQLRSALYNEETGSGYAMDFAGDLPSDASMPGDIVIYNGTVTKAVAVESQPPQVQDDSADADIALLSMDAAATTGTVPHIEEYTVDASTVGIVSDVDEDSGTLTVISGDVDGKVAKVTLNASQVTTLVSVANAQQAGYGVATLDFTVDGDDGTTETIYGTDASGYITDLQLQLKQNQQYEDTDTTTISDTVHGVLILTDIPAETIKSNSNTIHVRLPDQMDYLDDGELSGNLEDKDYWPSDGSHVCGSYRIVQGTDGHWYAVLHYNNDYISLKDTGDGVDTSGAKVTSKIEFNFRWDKNQVTTGGTTNIKINEHHTITVTITDDTTSDDKQFKLEKSVGSLSYKDGDAYLQYTVKLTVSQDYKGALDLKDVLSLPDGVKAEYIEDSLSLSATKNGTPNLPISWTGSGSEKTLTIGNDSSTIAAGTYQITYRIKLPGFGTTDVSGKVGNTISIPGKDVENDASRNVTTKAITKTGKAGADNTITWTVTINDGDALRNLKDAKFTDTILSGQTLDPKQLTVKKTTYSQKTDKKGNFTVDSETTTTTVELNDETFKNNTITYPLEDGYNKYTITYTTKYTGDVDLGGTTVSNTGKVTDKNGMDGEDTGTATIASTVLSKEAVGEPEKSSGDKTLTLHWKSTVDATDVSGYIYYDYSGTLYYNNAQHKAQEIVQDSVKITAKSGKTYDLVALQQAGAINFDYSHSNNNVECGLFSIDFSKINDIQGPLTIAYSTTVDLTQLPQGFKGNVVNYCQLNSGTIKDAQQTIENVSSSKSYLLKFGGDSYDWNEMNAGSGNITLAQPGDKIPWHIILNKDGLLTWTDDTEWTVTDVIPVGLVLDESSIAIHPNGGYTPVLNKDYSYSFTTNDKGETVLTFTLLPDAFSYEQNGNRIIRDWIDIRYCTTLDSNHVSGSTMVFTNRASFKRNDIDMGDTEFTETVTTKVIGKSGTFDQTTGDLTYQVWVNPHGATLFNGEPLTLLDAFTPPDALKNKDKVILQDITVFEAQLQDGTLVTTGKSKTLTPVSDGGTPFSNNAAEASVNTDSYYVKWNNKGDQLMAWTKVPDSTPLVLVFHYTVDVENLIKGTQYPLKNKVTLSGNTDWKAETNDGTFTYSSSGTSIRTYTSDRLVLTKYSQTPDNVLSGAKFRLAHYDANSKIWVDDGSDFVTNDKGTYTLDSLNRNTLYRLHEVEAPEGYLPPFDPYTYFAISENAGYTPPSESGYNAANYQLYLASQNNADAQALADEGDDIPSLAANNVLYYTFHAYVNNLPKSSTDKTGSLTVRKQWKDSLGNAVEGSTTGLPAVRLTLTRLTKDGDTAIQTVVDTVTLNAGNGWTHTWNNLITRDNITYTVTEEALTGYTASYTFNNTALEAGASITVTPDSTDNLVVTNQADQSGYKLPSTGGAGTKLYTAGGMALMLAALVCGFCTKRRRERRAH